MQRAEAQLFESADEIDQKIFSYKYASFEEVCITF